MLIRNIKKILRNYAPGIVEFINSRKIVKSYYHKQFFRHWNGGSDFRAKQALIKHYGKKIIAGPFQGMAYGDNSTGSSYVAKLVGSYEEELHSIIEQIIASKPSIVIDVGCAEGYYAIGFATLLPQSNIYAYDILPDAREFCGQLARINKAKNVHIGGLFSRLDLENLTKNPAFILCDCEGFEAELFNEESVPLLKECDFLIEFHDFIVPGITHTLQERFSQTHSIQIVDTQPRDPQHYDCLKHVPPADRGPCLSENRPGPMQWGYFQSLSRRK